MKTKTVHRTSVFPANIDDVFNELQKLGTLQYIAAPYASFTPMDETKELIWTAGVSYSFRFRLFGVIPYGTHRINVIRFDKEQIYTREGNEHVPVWNHEILLKDMGDCCEYTDNVEIGAGRKTNIIYIWAWFFYRHRQKKWIKMLKRKKR
jgi:hypothetical protein